MGLSLFIVAREVKLKITTRQQLMAMKMMTCCRMEMGMGLVMVIIVRGCSCCCYGCYSFNVRMNIFLLAQHTTERRWNTRGETKTKRKEAGISDNLVLLRNNNNESKMKNEISYIVYCLWHRNLAPAPFALTPTKLQQEHDGGNIDTQRCCTRTSLQTG